MRLDGDRIYLRPLTEQDTDHILRWRADPAVVDQLFSKRPPTRAEHEAWFANLQGRGDRIEFVIVIREGEYPVGTIGLGQISRERGEAEYGVMIGDGEWRGKGVAREASELILSYAFDTLNLQTVILNLFADNAPARTLYKRLGFAEDPILAGERQKGSARRKTMGMVITRDTWRRCGDTMETTE